MKTLTPRMRITQLLRRYAPALGLIVVCFIASAPLWIGSGVIYTHAGGDSPFLLQRTYELVANLRAGVFPARWMPDAAYGFGYPFFNFYAALPYYIAGILNLLGFDLLIANKLTQTLGMLAAGFAMYGYARRRLPVWGAWLAACAYVLAPYHLANLYVRGDSLQEFWAFAWYPLILLGVDRVAQTAHEERRRLGWLLMLAGALAGLVLTHNVSALIFAPFIVIYTLVRLGQMALSQPLRSTARSVIWLAVAVILAVGLSAWFWVPAIGEAGGVQLGYQTTGYLDFNNHFHSENLIQPALLFNYGVNAALDVFALGLAQVVLMLIGACIWVIRGSRRADAWLTLMLALLATLMITPISKPVWDSVPGLALAQFPWRFLSVQALFGALLIGGVSQLPVFKLGGKLTPRVALLRGGVIATCGALLLLALPGIPNERLDIQARDVNSQSLQFFEWFSGNIGTTIRAEYLPATAQPRPYTGNEVLQQERSALAITGEVGRSQMLVATPNRQDWLIAINSPTATISLPMIYWPGWAGFRSAANAPAANANWSAISLSPYPISGWVMLTLPQGEHTIRLQLQGTDLQRGAELVSLFAALLICLLLVIQLWMTKPNRAFVLRLILCTVGSVALAAAAAWIAGRMNPPTNPAMLTVDFENRQFPHRAPIVFRSGAGDDYELTGATIQPAQVRAGERFTVTTQWKDQHAPASFGVEQELPSGGNFAALFRYARSTDFTAGAVSSHIALTDALPGPLLLRLMAKDAAGNTLTPTMLNGQTMYRSYLVGLSVIAPKVITSVVAQPVVRTFPNGIQLRKIDWYQPAENTICFRASWIASQPLAGALHVSYQLLAQNGQVVAQADGQPQAGLMPTWAWQPGIPVLDTPCVTRKHAFTVGSPYTLRMRWYSVIDQRSFGELVLIGVRDNSTGPFTPRLAVTDHSNTVPEGISRAAVTFGDAIQLHGYSLTQDAQTLSVTLYWSAKTTMTQDYKSFLHLAPLTTTEPIRQIDQYTLDGRYPTGMWVRDEIITEVLKLDVSDVPAGRYQVAVGWYDPDTLVRLPALSGGTQVKDGRYVLAEITR